MSPALRMRRPAMVLAACVVMSAGVPDAARAEPPRDAAALRIETLAASCAACHGTEGRAVPQAEVPGLAGLPAPYLREQMLAFRLGTRPGTVMPQLAKGYTPEQIDRLADWFAHRAAAR